MDPKANYPAALESHYATNWSTPVQRMRWERGPIEDLPADFRVLIIPRSPETTAYATRCMSQPGDESRLELHFVTRHSDAIAAELVELLTAVAHFHRTGSRLGPGHSVNFGRPWLEGSICTYGLVSLPYLDGPELEWLEQPRVRFLWLIPVTRAEIEFKRKYGSEALEQRFEEAHFDYLDPGRPSII